MTTEYKETVTEPGDVEDKVLSALSDGSPFIFIVGHLDPLDGSIDLKVSTGGGIPDVETVKNLLRKTMAALP